MSEAPSRAPCLLLAEDDADVAEQLSIVLEDAGYAVKVARNGVEALAHMRIGPLPDLVLTDIEMPLLTGTELATRMLVEDCGREHIPIVVLSGVADLEAVVRRIGTPYFLAKPFRADAACALVARALLERTPPSPQFGAPAAEHPAGP